MNGDRPDSRPVWKSDSHSYIIVPVAFVIVIILILAVIWERPRNDLDLPIVIEDIESLERFNVTTFENTTYLDEGEIDRYEILKDHLPSVNVGQVVLIRNISVRIEFRDEEDINQNYKNQPDTFRLWIVDGGGFFNNTSEASSFNNDSTCHAQWRLGAAWIAIGNTDSIEFGDQEIVWLDSIGSLNASVEMVEAGDYIYPRGQMNIFDPGNSYKISITFDGRLYSS